MNIFSKFYSRFIVQVEAYLALFVFTFFGKNRNFYFEQNKKFSIFAFFLKFSNFLKSPLQGHFSYVFWKSRSSNFPISSFFSNLSNFSSLLNFSKLSYFSYWRPVIMRNTLIFAQKIKRSKYRGENDVATTLCGAAKFANFNKQSRPNRVN